MEPQYDADDREAAHAEIAAFLDDDGRYYAEESDAMDEWFGELPELTDPALFGVDEEAFALWFVLDRPLEDGRRPIEHIASHEDLAPGVRAYLEALGRTRLELYEVADIVPGETLVLREVFAPNRVVEVRERSGSRGVERYAWLVARIVEAGVSGKPEIERGAFLLPRYARAKVRDEVDDSFAARDRAVAFRHIWVETLDPPRPNMANTDGEELLPSKVVFRVHDAESLVAALDGEPALRRDGDRWSWVADTQGMKDASLAQLEIDKDRLFVDTNSLQRAERARALVERIAKAAVKYRVTIHEDIDKLLDNASSKPMPRTSEELEELAIAHMDQHYRAWIDDPEIPMFKGCSPRAAARDPKKRGVLIEALKDLENQYYRALRDGGPAYDPSWMWVELDLELPRKLPPPLAHESMARVVSGYGALIRDLAKRLGKRADFDVRRVFTAEEVAKMPEVDKFLDRFVDEADPADAAYLGHWIELGINHELHHRKTFWVGEGLSALLDQTTADAPSELLRLPFAAIALAFTDRFFLGLAERTLTSAHNTDLMGHRLKAATVYLREQTIEAGQRALSISLAVDALGADWPYVITRVLPVDPGATVAEIVRAPSDDAAFESSRLARLFRVALNAVLCATSATVEPIVLQPARAPAGPVFKKPPAIATSDEVFHLPGHIDLKLSRRVQTISRVPGGGQLLHRFMVRGHWRRAPDGLKWIEPYWKGPDMAEVIERAYRMET